uniref:Serpentine receptor class gamma n=1 Tax=Caenorhabditis tropicalis TaxID=1561998 RepID=A0A1I7TQP9_9PELO
MANILSMKFRSCFISHSFKADVYPSLAFIMIVDTECLLFIPIITLENLAVVHSYNKGDDATCASTTDCGANRSDVN